MRANSVASYRARQRVTGFIVAALASLGLAVASLNIMNLMLVRVLRGGKDIGILRSLGATRTAIARRYLGNAAALGGLGGVLGVGLGYALVAAFNAYIRAADPQQAQAFIIGFSLPVVGVGFVLALLVTTLFALYPAIVAARTDVVDALKGL